MVFVDSILEGVECLIISQIMCIGYVHHCRGKMFRNTSDFQICWQILKIRSVGEIQEGGGDSHNDNMNMVLMY